MKNLIDLEKKINSELTTKINKTEIKHEQLYIEIDKDDFIDACSLFWSANRVIAKTEVKIPNDIVLDSEGIIMQIKV